MKKAKDFRSIAVYSQAFCELDMYCDRYKIPKLHVASEAITEYVHKNRRDDNPSDDQRDNG